MKLVVSNPPLDVESARAAMLRDREAVTRDTGLRFVTIVCPHCGAEFDGCGASDGIAEGRAITGIVAHVVKEHGGGVSVPPDHLDYGRPA